jgi:hypothetical protein
MDNKIIRNSLGEMFIESETNLENEFLKAFSAGNGSEEDLGGEVSARTSPDVPDTPLQEDENIKQTLEKPEGEVVDTKDWDNFSIDTSVNYSAKLQAVDQQALDPQDAKKKSFFIKYVDPDNGEIFGVMGPMYGINRENGIGQAWVGGYETQADAEEDLHKMKQDWAKFPSDRDYMLVELSELSPDLVEYEKKKQDELPELVKEQEDEANKADKKEVTEVPEVPEMEVTEAPVAEAKPSQTTPQPSLPKPIKKVPASFMSMRLIRESSIQRLKNIKGY